MKQWADVEEQRRIRQASLDRLKSAAERNRWGQFSTPFPLAVEVIKLALQYRSDPGETIRFLDPAFGTGAFLSALYATAGEIGIDEAVGIELDPLFFEAAQDLWRMSQARIIQDDFTTLPPATLPTKANFLICNPPYIRHHHLRRDQKEMLRQKSQQMTGLALNGLAGMYCYFLLIAHEWLDADGTSTWLIPTEFMEANYGAAIREYLTTRVALRHIHRFHASDTQFADALVSSAVVIFQKADPDPASEVCFTVGGSPTNPQSSYQMRVNDLHKEPKWTRSPQTHRVGRSRQDLTLGDLFEISRGIATGANSFFILTREEAVRRSLPDQFLRPILPSPRYLKASIIAAELDGFPKGIPQFVLVDCDLPENTLQEQYPMLWDYFESGMSQGLHQRYLTSRRTPWYRQEARAYTPFLCTYMGRSTDGNQPFSFIWNQSQATAPNVYHLLYPRKHWAALLMNDLELQAQIFDLLSRVSMEDLMTEGRTYGGGLHKIEPREFYGIGIPQDSTILNFLRHQYTQMSFQDLTSAGR